MIKFVPGSKIYVILIGVVNLTNQKTLPLIV